MLIEKMVNTKNILESPHVLPAKVTQPNYVPFSPVKYLIQTHKVSCWHISLKTLYIPCSLQPSQVPHTNTRLVAAVVLKKLHIPCSLQPGQVLHTHTQGELMGISLKLVYSPFFCCPKLNCTGCIVLNCTGL